MMIEIKSVSLDYGVKDLDLTIKKGEFLLWKNNSHSSDQRPDPGILSGRDDRERTRGRRACA